MRIAYDVHKWLMKYYNHILKHTEQGKLALSYLKNRGINEATIDKFNLGYAIKDSNTTLGFLKGKGYNELDLVNRRVMNVSQNGNYFDPFFDRIVFPIEDYEGRVCSFGGRAMEDENKIKYLNSPESRIFKKHDNLYGFKQAKRAVSEEGYVLVLEGYFDLLQAHQYGLENSVASLGTALTIEQALLIKSITDNAVIVFDDDEAGIEASFRSATMLERVGCQVVIGRMQNGQDPDEWFIENKDKQKFIDDIVKNAMDRKDFYVFNKVKTIDINNPSERFTLLNEILSHISNDDIKERSNWLKMINHHLKVPTKELNEVMKNE